eukprot:m.20694 g.20694  ORF g.20694 m.20694 type:complete len:103 (+) comp12535_c0_seq1:162-470(+)
MIFLPRVPTSSNGSTAFILASRHDHTAVVERLTAAPDLNIQNQNGNTALNVAKCANQIEVLPILQPNNRAGHTLVHDLAHQHPLVHDLAHHSLIATKVSAQH